jgi:hypothetical protein
MSQSRRSAACSLIANRVIQWPPRRPGRSRRRPIARIRRGRLTNNTNTAPRGAGPSEAPLGVPNRGQNIYALPVSSDVWVGAITTLVGAALGGAISFVLSRQQLNDARLQRREAEETKRRRRSADRRFNAYAEFLTRFRAYRNGVEIYYLHPDSRPSINDLDALVQGANDASALVFLVVESEETYQGCRAILNTLLWVRTIIHGIEPSGVDDPWPEINMEFGRTTRYFQNAARDELGVTGPTHPWPDARPYPGRSTEPQAPA